MREQGEVSQNLIKWHPVVAFYILAFAISWVGWIPQALHARGRFPFDHPILSFLGAGGPTLAAVVVTWVLKGRDGLRTLFAPLLAWRVSWIWYLFVFLFWFIAAAVALGVATLVGIPFPALSTFTWPALVPIFLTMVLSNVWEEIGWRGFALPHLQARFGDLRIAVVMGLLWSLWHLPLLLNPTSPMAALPWVGEILFSLALTVIYIWLYNQTEGRLLFVTIFHAMSNTLAFVMFELSVFVASYPYVVVVTTVVACIIVGFGWTRWRQTLPRCSRLRL